jgi:thioredoxin
MRFIQIIFYFCKKFKSGTMKNILFTTLLSIAVLTVGCASHGTEDKQSVTGSENNAGKAVKITRQEFIELVYNYEANPEEWVYEGDLPAIVDFYADWCAPCRIVAPILDELAKEYEGRIRIYKVDTDKEKDLARAFNIRSIPTMLFIPSQGRPQMSQGALPKETLKQVIDSFMLAEQN